MMWIMFVIKSKNSLDTLNNIKTAFLTEMGFEGKIPSNHPNARTEFAWMYALNADHFNIRNLSNIKNYDNVFIIIPKGEVYLNAVGSKLIQKPNPISYILSAPSSQLLRNNNCKKIYYIQEGPTWLFNDYNMVDQINFYNQLNSFDGIFAHNEHDAKFYKGLFPGKKVEVIRSLLIEDLIKNISPKTEEKVIIGGNFAHWYGGFQSYIIAQSFDLPVWVQDSHCKREGEDQLPNLNHFPRLIWVDWMKELSKFKYAVHLMPTIAAGTFSLNCAYFGIPCIGNKKVDTQKLCHPDLSVDVEDVEKARILADKLKEDKEFYLHCVNISKENYRKYYDIDKFKKELIL
jgi:hypothetical protein